MKLGESNVAETFAGQVEVVYGGNRGASQSDTPAAEEPSGMR